MIQRWWEFILDKWGIFKSHLSMKMEKSFASKGLTVTEWVTFLILISFLFWLMLFLMRPFLSAG